MTNKEAITLATEFADEQGYEVGRYKAEAKKDGANWRVDFRRRSGSGKTAPGDFFTVLIDDGLKSVERLIPGK